MQSNSDFIPNFAKKSGILRELTKKNAQFKWGNEDQKCFEHPINSFCKDTLMRYFDMKKTIYIFTDIRISGLGAILAQGNTIRCETSSSSFKNNKYGRKETPTTRS